MRVHPEEVRKIARGHHLEPPLKNQETFTRFLTFWWCQKFNRPLKDPLLKEYTLDELLYEFLRYYYLNPEADPKKELEQKKIEDDDENWIRDQLANARAAAESAAKAVQDIPAAQDLPDISTKFE